MQANNIFTDSKLATTKVESHMRALYPNSDRLQNTPMPDAFEGFTTLGNIVAVGDLWNEIETEGRTGFGVSYFTDSVKNYVFHVGYAKESDAELTDTDSSALVSLASRLMADTITRTMTPAERTLRLLGLTNIGQLLVNAHLNVTAVDENDEMVTITLRTVKASQAMICEALGETGVSDCYVIVYNKPQK